MSRDDAFAAMASNYAKASDKVVARATASLANGRAQVTLRAPNEPGVYFVKAVVTGPAAAAAGSTRVRVAR
jgi:hypothetical protein